MSDPSDKVREAIEAIAAGLKEATSKYIGDYVSTDAIASIKKTMEDNLNAWRAANPHVPEINFIDVEAILESDREVEEFQPIPVAEVNKPKYFTYKNFQYIIRHPNLKGHCFLPGDIIVHKKTATVEVEVTAETDVTEQELHALLFNFGCEHYRPIKYLKDEGVSYD